MQCISSKVSWPCKCLVTCLLPDSDYALLKFLPRFCFLSSYRYFADKIRWVHTDIALFLPSFLFFRDVAAYAMRKLLFDVSAPCFCVWWAKKQKSEPSLHSPSTFPFLENSNCPGCRPSEKMKFGKAATWMAYQGNFTGAHSMAMDYCFVCIHLYCHYLIVLTSVTGSIAASFLMAN